jgi:hypothetical protein
MPGSGYARFQVPIRDTHDPDDAASMACAGNRRRSVAHDTWFVELEVRAGIEPASADLQSDASPLCHRTPGDGRYIV